MVQNHSLVFKSVPDDYPVPGKTLKKEAVDLDIEAALEEGCVLTKTTVISIDPYMRKKMRDSSIASYTPAYELNKPLSTLALGEVIKSNNPKLPVGVHVAGWQPYSEYNVFTEEQTKALRVVENKEKLPWATHLGAAGMPGATAYYSLNKLGIEPKKGETIFVSAGAGAVGSMVIALAQRQGLKVIASAGSDEKVEYLRSELGVEVAFNYKKEKTREVLSKQTYQIYFDNVGGETLDDVFATIETKGRIICCGAISDYNTNHPYGLTQGFQLVSKSLYVRGFILDMTAIPEFFSVVPPLVASGEIKKPREHIYKGLDDGEAFLDLMKGGNFGKAIVSLE